MLIGPLAPPSAAQSLCVKPYASEKLSGSWGVGAGPG